MALETTPTGDIVDKWLKGQLEEPVHWLGNTLDKQAVRSDRISSRFIKNSVAWVLYIRMTEKKTMERLEMNPDSLTRLGTLIAVFRNIAPPRMTPEEREEIGDFFAKNRGAILDPLELKEAAHEVKEDLEYISNTFHMPLVLKPYNI